MKKVVFVLCLIYQGVMAQNVVNQVLILNEGRYDYTLGEIETPVTIGSYDPVTNNCLLYTSPSPRDGLLSRMPSSA